MARQEPSQRPTPWRPLSALPTADDRERAKAAETHVWQLAAVIHRWATTGTPTERLVRTGAALRVVAGDDGLGAVLAEARRQAIEERRAQGATWPTIARELGVTVSRVHQLRRPPAPQGTTTRESE